MFARRKDRLAAGRRVSDDWVAILPREKMYVFETVVQRWECSYAMMSVALDDAITLRAGGQLICAQQQIAVAADLFERLAGALTLACDILASGGEGVPDIPVEPLRSRFFRGDTAQSAASWNGILHRITVGNRSRFFHKLRILSATLRELGTQFVEKADDIRQGISTEPSHCWKALDSIHYDFNTCLREAEIVLKSYLRAIPGERLPALASRLDASPAPQQMHLQPSLSQAPA